MKRKHSEITDLSYDVLRHIMAYVARSSDGAVSIARVLSVCRIFKDLADDTDILKSVVFDNVTLSGVHESFWQLNGLLARCVRKKNVNTFYLLKEYIGKLFVYLETYDREFSSGRTVIMLRTRAVETRNTRARLVALKSSEEEFRKVNDAFHLKFKEMELVRRCVESCCKQKYEK